MNILQHVDLNRVIFNESKLAKKYCIGKGVELGRAAHNEFGLTDCINVAPKEREEFWKQSQIDMCGTFAKIDLYGTAEEIPVDDNEYDYIISSHVIEHVSNPIRAFIEWDRILKKDGIVFMIFPKRDADPKDVDRPISELQDFISQYRMPRPLSDEHLHIWIFTLRSMIELIDWCIVEGLFKWELIDFQETDDKVSNGHTVVYRKK